MDENRRSRAVRPRKRSSPEVVARLQRSRRRTMDRRAAARASERTVTAAIQDYISAWHAIQLVEQRRDKNIVELKKQIDQATARAADEIAGHQRAQAEAAATMHSEGHNDDEIAELLEITPKQARQLLGATRKIEGGNLPGINPSHQTSAGPAKSKEARPDDKSAVPKPGQHGHMAMEEHLPEVHGGSA